MAKVKVKKVNSILAEFMSHSDLKQQLWDMFRTYTASKEFEELKPDAKHVAAHSFQLNIEMIDELAKAAK